MPSRRSLDSTCAFRSNRTLNSPPRRFPLSVRNYPPGGSGWESEPGKSDALAKQTDLNRAGLHLVEDVAADLRDLVQLEPPWRMHVSCVVMRGVAHLVEPDLARD